MASDKLADLEAKVRSLIERSDQLKRRNAQLVERLRDADTRLSGQATTLRRWEKEREWLRGRLRKALNELNSIEFEGDRDENLRG